MMSGKAESVAKLINSQSRAHRRDVRTLLDMLPSEPLSWQSDSGGKSFQVGSFVHKDVCGVRPMTRQFPETSKALHAYVKALFPGLEFSLGFVLDSSERGKGSKLQKLTKAVIGVYRTPEQFVAEAAGLGHPSQLSTLLPAEILTAVRKIHRVGEATVAMERTATLRRWMSMAVELEPTEKSLKSSLPAFRKAVLQPKRLALFRALLQEVGHEDTELVNEILQGFSLTGKLSRSNVFVQRFRPAEQSEAQLRAGAKRLREGLLATVKVSEDPVIDQGVLKATKKFRGRPD